MRRNVAEVVGFEYNHSLTGEGWPDVVVLEIDDGNECESRRYRSEAAGGTVDRDALLALAAEIDRTGGFLSSRPARLVLASFSRRIRAALGN